MRDDGLQQLLVDLAHGLDDTSRPVDLDELVAKGRHGQAARPRRHHRPVRGGSRLLLAAAAAVVTVLLAGSLVKRVGREPEPDDRLQMGASAVQPPEGQLPLASDPDDQPILTQGYGLTVTPSGQLRGGEEVRVELIPAAAGEVLRIAQCATEVVEAAAGSPGADAAVFDEWCGPDQPAPLGLSVVVRRAVPTVDGEVDCASAAGRCVVMVRAQAEGGVDDDRFAPLVFDPDLGPRPEERLELTALDGPAQDGQLVEVRGRGFLTGTDVRLRQCTGPPVLPDGSVMATCDLNRAPVVAHPDGAGTFVAQFIVYRDVAIERDPAARNWRACEPCVIAAGRTTVTVEVAPTGNPLHPTLSIAPAGPHAPGQPVGVRGHGFQVDPDGLETGIAYCPAEATRVESCGGGPELGDLSIAADGSFLSEGFELPGDAEDLQGVDCTAAPGRCVLAWYLTDAGFIGPGIPLDLTG